MKGFFGVPSKSRLAIVVFVTFLFAGMVGCGILWWELVGSHIRHHTFRTTSPLLSAAKMTAGFSSLVLFVLGRSVRAQHKNLARLGWAVVSATFVIYALPSPFAF